ncbi:YitT family protein [Filifactor villosus]|uniref:YitT family protein n=1 Tax=Filifactor villosus TaxID=29374 RepID=A0ABV9QLJ5_9FIRM
MQFNFKKFFIINLGLLIMSMGIYFFLMPSNLAVGGVTGLAIVLRSIIPSFPTGLFMIVINSILFVFAFLFIGKEFGGYTIYASFTLSGMITLWEILFPDTRLITDDLLINLLYGILINGVGYSLIFNQNASTGGTDIVAKIINKFTHIDMGKSLFLSDFLITVMAGLTFGPKLGLYALLGILMNSVIIDKAIAGFNTRVNLKIITKYKDEVNHFILTELSRGTTIFYAEGGYSKDKKPVINTIVTRKEYIKIKNFVKDLDPQAFISINFVHEVLGEGFTYRKSSV